MDTENLLNAEKKQGGGKFPPGQSGNPHGRPRGSKARLSLRSMLEDNGEALTAKAVELALAGDTTALRLCLERVLPPIRAKDDAVSLATVNGTLSEQGGAILRAMAGGEVTPTEAGAMLSALATQARLVEATDLLQRIEILEKKHADT